MKKLLMVVLLGSFVFSGISINKSIGYSGLDDTVEVSDAMGVDFDLGGGLSIGYDTGGPGLLVKTGGPAGTTLRIGWNDNAGGVGSSTLGVGYNWWSSDGDGISTSLGTSIDYTSNGTTDATTVRINLGWGF